MAKWIADAMFVEGIYDLLIDLKQYPYLEARRDYVHTMTILNITEYLSTIDIDEPISIGKLKHKLAVVRSMGYAEDGGFPILSDGDVLEGYIATSEVIHGLEQLEATLSATMNEQEINQMPCYFKRLANNTSSIQLSVNHDLKTPIRDLLLDETGKITQPLNDFSQYIDHVK